MIKLKTLVVLISILFFNLLFADEHEYYEHKKNHIYKNLDYLDLNHSQLDKIREILIKYRKKYNKHRKERVLQEEKLKELFRKDYFDEDRYEHILEETIEEEIKLETKVLEKIHSVLNPKQREKFSYYLKEWRIE